MGGLSLPHLIILALVVLILFGRGRISEMMGDFGKGIKSFKRGMDEETDRPLPPRLEQQTPAAPAVPAPQQGYVQHGQGQQGQQGQGQPMSYDPVSAPPTTDPNPPHPAVAAPPPPQRQQAMPYDPVTAPPVAADDSRRGG